MSDIPKVSVIVPMYNPRPMILRGLNSLRNQTLRDIEIILVDDCSDETTLAEARKAASEDARIRILKTKANSGPGIARNLGIDNAVGEYLAFVDSDDFVSPDFLELLYRKAILYRADISKGSLINVNEAGVRCPLQTSSNENNSIRNGLRNGKPLYITFRSDHYSAIYRRAWVLEHQIRYGYSRYGEDSTFLLRATAQTKYIVLDDRACYYLVDNPQSLSKKISPIRFNDHLLSLREQGNFLIEHFGNNIDPAYIVYRVSWTLGIQAAAVRQGVYLQEAELFLEGIIKEIMRLPNISELAVFSPMLGALLEYHANLSTIVMRQIEGEYEESAIVEIIVRCFQFASLHPQRKDLYDFPLKEALDRGVAYYFGIGPYSSLTFRDRDRRAFQDKLRSELRVTAEPAFLKKTLRGYLTPKRIYQDVKKAVKVVKRR